MAQRRFWNWKDDDLTFDLARTFIGLIDHGLYRGFDPVLGSTMSLILKHDQTGASRVTKELEFAAKFGVAVTKQGVIIQEEEELEFAINPTGLTGRRDIIIVTHNYVDIEGGIEAIYSVIQGTEQAFPILPAPEKQEILGYLTLPANVSGLTDNGVIYQKAKAPNFAAHADYIEKANGFFITALDAKGNAIVNLLNPVNDQDAATKFYVLQAIAASVVFSTEEVRGIIELATEAEAVAGLDGIRAMTPATARAAMLARVATQEETNDGVVDNKFVTPKTLQNRAATEVRKGIAAIATETQAKEGSDDQTIITPYKLKLALPLTPVVLEIGDWDMESSASISIVHDLGADWDKVVSMDITVRNDANNQIVSLSRTANSFLMDDTNVQVTADTDNLTLDDFNAVGVNRGYITLWLKKDIVPPTAYISVNAGSDKTIVVHYLKYSTPVLSSITKTNSGYPSNLGTVNALVTLGAGTAGAVIELQYKKASDSLWYPLTSQVSLYNANPLIRNVTGQINDNSVISGIYPVRAKVILGGSIVMYTDEVNTDMTKNEGFSWAGSGSSTQVYTQIPINGYVEAVGAAVDSILWAISSEPSVGSGHLNPVDTADTIFTADSYGAYVLTLQASAAGAGTGSDAITVDLIAYTNHVPVITAVNNSVTLEDTTFANDYNIPQPDVSPYPYGKFNASIEATDEDGDLLRYSIVQVASYNPVTGATGAPVEPPTVKIEQVSPYSNKLTVRGLTSTAGSTPRPYYFKAVVDDGQGGIAEKGFTMNAPPITAQPPVTYYLEVAEDFTDPSKIRTTLVASPYDKISRVTAYISVTPSSIPQGSMAAHLRVASGQYAIVAADPSPILVPLGIITEIGSKMYRANPSSPEIIAPFTLNKSGVTSATVTFRAYDINNNLVATWSGL